MMHADLIDQDDFRERLQALGFSVPPDSTPEQACEYAVRGLSPERPGAAAAGGGHARRARHAAPGGARGDFPATAAGAGAAGLTRPCPLPWTGRAGTRRQIRTLAKVDSPCAWLRADSAEELGINARSCGIGISTTGWPSGWPWRSSRGGMPKYSR